MFVKLIPDKKEYLDRFLEETKSLNLTMSMVQKNIVDNIDKNYIMKNIKNLKIICKEHNIKKRKRNVVQSVYL